MVLTFAIKSAIILALLYVCMIPVFGKETFHRFNRLLAIGALLFSLFVPLLHLPVAGDATLPGKMTGRRVVELPTDFSIMVSVHETNMNAGWDWASIITYLYLGGAVFVFFGLLIQIWRMLYALRNGNRLADGRGNTIVLLNGKVSPFCFFRTIVMSVDDYEKNRLFILMHEQEHIRLLHYWDLVVLAVATIVQWFNPFVWLLGKKLKAIHEYEVDEAVINKGVDTTQYQKFLVFKAVGNRLQLFANNLNQGSLKSRIIMMNQKKSSRWRMLKVLTVVPVAMIVINVFATEVATSSVNDVHRQCLAKKTVATKKTGNVSNVTSMSVVSDKFAVSAPKTKNRKAVKFVEIMPEFSGGTDALMEFLRNNVKYPESAKAAKNQGKCVVRFLVKKDGSINGVSVAKSSGFEVLDEEAVRVVKSMPKWKPGMRDGKPIDVSYMAPLDFRLD